jgi:hypothetical protein
MTACKRCGASIYWDPERKSESGKWVPIDEETDEPHDCPENEWNSGRGGKGIDGVDAMAMSNAITNLENKMDSLNKNMLKLLAAIQAVQIRIEGQMPLFPTAEITAKEVSEPIVDPGDLEDN